MTFEYESEDVVSSSRGELLWNPANWPLFYETVRNMQTDQLLGVLDRQARHVVLPRLPIDFDARYESGVPENPSTTSAPLRENTACLRDCGSRSDRAQYEQRLEAVENGQLTFLQTALDLRADDGVSWFHPDLEELPALWALKLHGFEFLQWAYLTAASPADCPEIHAIFKSWIRDWAETPETRIGAPQYLRRAWTPHSVSLRILNLARYYAWCVDHETDTTFLQLLRRLVFKNALFLENHVEYDVGGNHLIENGIALVAAGILFENEECSWLSQGVSVLEDAADQFLDDGGHFERSPMYHVITLERYLTTLFLLRENNRPWPETLFETAQRATVFLSSIRPPDGRIPLLNDSVYGQAMELDSCLEYARAVDDSLFDRGANPAMESSGYFWLGDGGDRLLIDGGPFGPRHLPGHSHNDFFSILLWVNGTQLLTDTGTYHYAPGSRRQLSRSVRSHNTVQVGETEPIPIGGQYLAGKRLEPNVRYIQSDDYRIFDGHYRRDTSPEYRHRRRVVSTGDWWLVEDTVTDTDELPVRQRLHVHPDVHLSGHPSAQNGFALNVEGDPLAYVLSDGADSIIQRSTPYFPRFCVEEMRPSLVFESQGAGTMRFLLSTEPYSPTQCRELVSSLETYDEETDENQVTVLPSDTVVGQ